MVPLNFFLTDITFLLQNCRQNIFLTLIFLRIYPVSYDFLMFQHFFHTYDFINIIRFCIVLLLSGKLFYYYLKSYYDISRKMNTCSRETALSTFQEKFQFVSGKWSDYFSECKKNAFRGAIALGYGNGVNFITITLNTAPKKIW